MPGRRPCRGARMRCSGASRMVNAINRIGLAHPPYACATVGMLQVSPNSRNVIPGKVFFTIDFRHPDAEVLKGMGAEGQAECEKIARRDRPRARFQGDLVLAAGEIRR